MAGRMGQEGQIRGEASNMSKPFVFISYAHEDKEWMERIRVQLRTIEQLGEIEI